MTSNGLDVKAVLASLKDFQRKTVTHAFNRLYRVKHGSKRFLIADEVGLGKTLVARGIVAKTIEHLRQEGFVKQINIVYVCSNAAIAQQNVNRLNVTGQKTRALATRLTLLPLKLPTLGKRKLNFVSFTPGTTFDLKNSTGVWEERLLLVQILKVIKELKCSGLCNLMQCDVGKENWDYYLENPKPYDERLIQKFLRSLDQEFEIHDELARLCDDFGYYRPIWPQPLKERRNKIIGKLRKRLAKSCIDALKPNLVILDEFQRFKSLLGGDSDASILAKDLMDHANVRVLLLSATPYKMLTLYGEEENHYKDFLHTLGFLYNKEDHLKQVCEDLDAYRVSLYQNASNGVETRHRLQRRLRNVMVRTERVPATRDRDAMVDTQLVKTSLIPNDLHRASALDQLTRAIGAQEAIEYWKSAPYLLNFMKGYKLKEKFVEHIDSKIDLSESLKAIAPHLLKEESLKKYDKIDPGNSRLRALVDRTLSKDEWRLLWLPPSLPYIKSNAFSERASPTKSLVFSTWSVVPDVIAAVCSYTAERKRVQGAGLNNYFELYDSKSPLLVFRRTGDHVESMSTLLMLYPSPFLSDLIDPMRLAINQQKPISVNELIQVASERVEKNLDCMSVVQKKVDGRHDQAWYWAALAKHDFKFCSEFGSWLSNRASWRSILDHDKADEQVEQSVFAEHVEYFLQGAKGDVELGMIPDDLGNVLADMAIGSPAVCANRALRRIAPELKADSHAILQAASHIAEGFRSLFNSPDVRSMIEKEGVPYWRQVLRYCVEGDLQAVLDEYVHNLNESLGLMAVRSEDAVGEIAKSIRGALSIRTSNLEMDDIRIRNGQATISKNKIRCRYALRFADIKGDSEKVLDRAGVVRDAFNSPFRPFILATTSIGQEGLDFHNYCHRVWHWNLPRNPVDMEQREGRVNRYKGHAVRKNVARAIGLKGLSQGWNARGDPWVHLFRLAKRGLQKNGKIESELTPFWIYEEVERPSQVERLVPLPPFSSENARFRALIRSLSVYRLAFGQPRQEDLIEYLTEANIDWDEEMLREQQLNLAP